MLSYLLPAQARRQLLIALYRDAISGTASSLARHARISTTSAQVELLAMERVGLARRRTVSGQRLFAAVADHPHAATLRALLALPDDPAAISVSDPLDALDPDRTRADLAAHGAAISGYKAVVRTTATLEDTLARGVVLAREDVEVAQRLPALFIRHARRIDHAALTAALHDLRHKHTAGFLMSIAAELTPDPNLQANLRTQAQALKDHRRKRPLEFFSPRAHPKLADPNQPTLPLAKEWNFAFPLPLADFRG